MADYKKITSLLEEVRVQLLEAQISFDIWLALLPTPENDILETFNMFAGFFKPTRAAHADRIFITIHNVLDSKNKRAPTFHRALDLIQQNPDLVCELDVESLRNKLISQGNAVRKIEKYRHTRAAHWQTGANFENVTAHEVRELLSGLQNIFNEINESMNGWQWHFHLWEQEDVSRIIDSLNEYHILIPIAIDAAWSAIPCKDEPNYYMVRREIIERLRQACGGNT